jgi:hypothetical protein
MYITQRRIEDRQVEFSYLNEREEREAQQRYRDINEENRQRSRNHVVRGIDFPNGFAGRIMQNPLFREWIEENNVDHDTPYQGTELVWSITNSRFEMIAWDLVEIIRVQPVSEEEVVLSMDEES